MLSKSATPILLFGISFCLLAFEITQLRILAILQWYHFAYLIISLAMLGFAASGTALSLGRDFWFRHLNQTAISSLLLTALSMAAANYILALIPMDLFITIWKPVGLLWLILLCLSLFLPLLFGAFFIILVFSASPRQIGMYYSANLLGSGAGSLGALAILHFWHPLAVPYLLALLVWVFSLILLNRTRAMAIASGLVGLIIGTCWLLPAEVTMSQYKPLARALLMPDTHIVHETYDPLGVIHVVHSPHLRSASGLSLTFDGEIPPLPMVFRDGESAGALPISADTHTKSFMHATIYNLPYWLGTVEQTLILGSGTGMEVQRALAEGVRSVTAVEKNRNLTDLPDKALPDHYSVYNASKVRKIIEEPRSFLEQTQNHFDLILLPANTTRGGASTGMQSLYENHLLTIEAMSGMLNLLNIGGMVAVSTVIDTPPRSPLKLFATMAQALRMQNMVPEQHLVAIRSWNMISIVMSNTPLSAQKLHSIQQFAGAFDFEILYPAQQPDSIKRPVSGFATEHLPSIFSLLAENPYMQTGSPFHLTPATDEQPYFNHFLTLDAAAFLLRTFGTAGLIMHEWSYIVAAITLLLLIVAGFCLTLLPLLLCLKAGPPSQSNIRPLLYFSAIGAGFMFVEILFMQKLVLILGDPIYSVASVLAALLIFAGIGSLLSDQRIFRSSQALVWSAALLILLLGLFFLLLPTLASILATISLPWRFTAAIMLVAPVALIMGLFFPTGIRNLEQSGQSSLIPWAWGINGFISVIAAPIAILTAVSSGFVTLGLAGMGSYLLAALLRPTWRESGNWEMTR
jgi:hypothetical protein